MSYDIKKLSEVEALPEVPEGANMIAEVGGQIKRVPAIESLVPPLPADNPGNKQLVTDSTGETKWIDQYFGEAKSFITRLEEQTIDFSSAFNLGFAPKGGVNYVVYVDGRIYNLTGVTIEIIPNEIYAHKLIPEDRSFLIDEYYMSFEDKASHVVKIEEESMTIKTLDDKFLSNSVVRMDSSCEASGKYSHAEGFSTQALGDYSHSEGGGSRASGDYSHAEGQDSVASGNHSHAEGHETTASGIASHAEGWGTTAFGECSHVQGRFNLEDINGKYAHVVGNGSSKVQLSNAHTLDWSGNAFYAGTVEGTAMIVKSSTPNSTKRFKITVDDSGTLTATEVTT